jgi:glycerophosphoryl diester phosphodiesterase
VQQRLPPLDGPPVTFAHRGARAHAPENTLDSFRLGLRLGASGLESDVWRTADGVCVLEHDGVIRQGLRKRPVSRLLRADLPRHVPSLADLLQACPGDWHLSLDLKEDGCGPEVVDVVAGLRPDLLERLWLCHPSLDVLTAVRASGPDAADVKLVHSSRLNRLTGGPERHAMTLSERGIDALNLHHTEWTGGLVTLVHRFGVRCFAWDVQFEHQLETVLRMGADGIYSDWVDRMVDAFRKVYPTP